MSDDIINNIEALIAKIIEGRSISDTKPELLALLIEIEKLKALKQISNNIEGLDEVLRYLNNNVYEIKEFK